MIKMSFLIAIVAFFGLELTPVYASEPPKTVVLVHGAFADGSVWRKVIPLLQNQGVDVIAVQNPLTSLEEDVAFTTRAIEIAQGDVVLVGHSWGGMVISAAGLHEKVKSLVYISALAPAENETAGDILHEYYEVKKIPQAPGFTNLIADQYGYLRMSQAAMIEFFAPDIPEEEAKLLAATQGQFHGGMLSQALPSVAWRNKPSWYLVTTEDEMIAPQLMRSLATKIGATTTELKTSHAPMLSKPDDVATTILQAF